MCMSEAATTLSSPEVRTDRQPIIEINGVSKVFPGGVKAVDHADFTIKRGEFKQSDFPFEELRLARLR